MKRITLVLVAAALLLAVGIAARGPDPAHSTKTVAPPREQQNQAKDAVNLELVTKNALALVNGATETEHVAIPLGNIAANTEKTRVSTPGAGTIVTAGNREVEVSKSARAPAAFTERQGGALVAMELAGNALENSLVIEGVSAINRLKGVSFGASLAAAATRLF